MIKLKIVEFFRDISKEYEESNRFYFKCDLDDGTCVVHPINNGYVKLEITEVCTELKNHISQVAKSKSLRAEWINTTKFKLFKI